MKTKAPQPPKGTKFSVAKPPRMGSKAAGTSMSKSGKAPKFAKMSGAKSMKGC